MDQGCNWKVRMPTLVPVAVPTLNEFFASLDPDTWEYRRPQFGAIEMECERFVKHEGSHKTTLPDGTPFLWPQRTTND